MPESAYQVALPLPLPGTFDYAPPDGTHVDSSMIGRRVRVSFGHRTLVGWITGTGPSTAGDALKPAEAILDPNPWPLPPEWMASLDWLSRYLHAPLGEVIATALPTPLRQGEPLPDTHRPAWTLSEAGHTALPGLRAGRPKQLAERLAQGTAEEDVLETDFPRWREALRNLRARDLVEAVALPARREPASPAVPGPTPNEEQREAISHITSATHFQPFLLEGVTGSGKTEVYLHAIADALARGQQALVLVPEIGLTPQMLQRFRERLGVPIHALHSGLSDGERTRSWTAAMRGDARVIVGTRSAIFVPLPEAGLIIVDEEHDTSYKQFDGIRYHARDFAIVRARALDVPVVLGSATPSLESLHNAQAGRYAHLRLSHRAGNALPPRVRVLDVRKRALEAGLSQESLAAIQQALDAGGQVLVFKNRRGYAPVLQCHDCGWSAHCPRCSTEDRPMPMTVHAQGKRLQCHHCGTRRPSPQACPDCASLALQPQGNGTERIEDLLAERFAAYPVIRIDRGSTQRRDALQQHFDALGTQPGILIGTQMLAKGHDLPNLTLVVVVGIDEGLYSADFRSHEKLAQLLIQVAGRAGRADKPGDVLLQTHHPEHPLLVTLLSGGYRAFADAELTLREAAGLPPFAHHSLLRAEAKHADAPRAFLEAARALAPRSHGLSLHPVLPAPMPRRAGFVRMQWLLSSPQRARLQQALAQLMPQLYALPDARKVRWSLDVDPVDGS